MGEARHVLGRLRDPDAQLDLAAWIGGFLLAWVATGTRLLTEINPDNAAYVATEAMGWQSYSFPPWNSHFGVGHLLHTGALIARASGGTTIDGFRLVEALFFASACALVADATRRLAGSRLLGGTLTVTWATVWVNAFLLFTLEYNILFLAPGAGILWLCALRLDDWTLRDSMVAGALGALAVLVSWQAGLYLAPACYAALIGGVRQRRLWVRVRDAVAVAATFLATFAGWSVLISTISTQSLGALLRVQFSRPVPAAIPSSPGELLALLADVRSQLTVVGTAMLYQWQHSCCTLYPVSLSPPAIGAVAMIVILGLFGASTWQSWRTRQGTMHLLAATLVLFTLATAIYRDVEYAYLKRFNFLPLLLVLMVAGALGRWRDRPRRAEWAIAALLIVLTVTQSTLALDWNRRRYDSYPELFDYNPAVHTDMGTDERNGQSWFAYFRRLRRQYPAACRFIFSLAEVADAKWNVDISATLYSELPTHLVLGDPEAVREWRFPPHVTPAATARAAGLSEGCAWVSRDAQRILIAGDRAAPSGGGTAVR